MSQKPATDKYVQFRGEPRALVSHGSSLVFVTVHPEGQPTALYRLGLEDARLAADPLPAGGVALALANNRLFIAGSEGQLSWAPIEAGEPKPLGSPLEPAPTALVCVGAGEQVQLAALCDEELVLVSARTGAELQRIMLGAKGSALAVDPSGAWLAVGLRDGTLRIFERALEESRPADEARLKHSSSGKIHQGEITALLFELGAELRVLSTGVDKKILVTHARGALEPENRSGKSEHDHPILGMIHGTEGRFYTAGHDAAIKAWPGTSGQKRPYTFRDKVGKVVALTMTDYRGRVHLAAACADSTLRVFSLEEGKPQERVSIVHGAYGWAVKTLRRKDPAIREGVLKTLARFNDAQAIELLGNQARVDEDHGLKVTATELLGNSQNPRAIKELESLLKAPEEAVRVAAFAGMRALEGTSSLRPIELALQVGRRDVGVQAVAALSERAEIDELAMDRLVKALDDEPREVRTAALVALERLHDEDSPEADILSLRSARADVR
ncbi:MAG: HEAT repeat domain-containing protein, partial [Myxococcales bacterium]|nr:HEAT repeat domain-containing protein [Myxococcales bacterium]